MSGKVFANGLEIACKVSKGKSVAAFPDPCWSPPSPPAGPVVIPYANTAYAKDVSNASKSVLIKDKPIAQKDKSFFKTSTGNEAATKAFGQGFFSKTLKGKAYFTSWSMNVMVEGYNVARHTDLTTHNHGSSTNTTPQVFTSEADVEKDCEKDIKKANEACGGGDKGENLQKKQKGEPTADGNQNNDKSIDRSIVQTVYEEMKKDVDAEIESYNDNMKDLAEQLSISVEQLKKELKLSPEEFRKKFAFDDPLDSKLFSPCPLELPKKLVSNFIASFSEREKTWKDQHCQDLFFIPSVSSIGPQKQKLEFESKVIEALGESLKTPQVKNKEREIKEHIAKADNLIKQYKDGDKNLNKYAGEITKKSKENKCLKARKCQLIPYDDAKKTGTSDQLLGNEKGCCPGQTGHHLIPDAWIVEKDEKSGSRKRKQKKGLTEKDESCKNYKEGKALVVCVEGANQSHGTHKKVHDATDVQVWKSLNIDMLSKEKEEARKQLQEAEEKKPASISEAIEMAVVAHESIAPQCTPKCIRTQLKYYYETQAGCNKNNLKPTIENKNTLIMEIGRSENKGIL